MENLWTYTGTDGRRHYGICVEDTETHLAFHRCDERGQKLLGPYNTPSVDIVSGDRVEKAQRIH